LKTYQHVLEVEKEAIKLACKYKVDIVFLADKKAWNQEGILPYINIVDNRLEIPLEQACYDFINYQFQNHLLKMSYTWVKEAYQDLKENL